MAGGHIDRAVELSLYDRPRYSRGRNRTIAEQRADAVRRQHASRFERETIRGEARVEADECRWGAWFMTSDVTRDGLGGEPHIGKGEFVRDDCAPSGGTEFDFCSHEGRINDDDRDPDGFCHLR